MINHKWSTFETANSFIEIYSFAIHHVEFQKISTIIQSAITCLCLSFASSRRINLRWQTQWISWDIEIGKHQPIVEGVRLSAHIDHFRLHKVTLLIDLVLLKEIQEPIYIWNTHVSIPEIANIYEQFQNHSKYLLIITFSYFLFYVNTSLVYVMT